ncbi:hypothetical protein KCU92_g7552, partial [Aureobasidium melanogenum]|jgi:hypothetical protein
MSTTPSGITETEPTPALDHEIFEQELNQASDHAAFHGNPYQSPNVLVKVRINLPSRIVLANWVKRFQPQFKWDSWGRLGCSDPAVHGAMLVTAQRTYPQRDVVMLMFSLSMDLWKRLQLSPASGSITFLENIVEDNVVGDTQLTYLLTRAAKRVNEGPLSKTQFADDLKRAWIAVRDGRGPEGWRIFTFPRVMFTAKLVNEHPFPDETGNPRKICWKDVLEDCHDPETIDLKVVSEQSSEEGCEVTFIMNKDYWPYLEAISEAYQFARYIERHAYRELSPDHPFTPSPEPQQAPVTKATIKRQKKKAKKLSKNKITKQKSKKSRERQQI